MACWFERVFSESWTFEVQSVYLDCSFDISFLFRRVQLR